MHGRKRAYKDIPLFNLFHTLLQTRTVKYQIQYNDPVCSNSTSPAKVKIVLGLIRSQNLQYLLETGKYALDIMEEAVVQGGAPYRFSSTYFGSLGYFIDKINGTQSNSPCFWTIFIGKPNGRTVLSPVGVSSLFIKSGQTLIMRYQRFEHS